MTAKILATLGALGLILLVISVGVAAHKDAQNKRQDGLYAPQKHD